MFEKIIDSIGATLVVVIGMLGGVDIILLFLILMMFDTFTGIMVAIKEKKVSSSGLRDGLIKKLAQLILTFTFAILCVDLIPLIEMGNVLVDNSELLGVLEKAPLFVMIGFTIAEFISLTENCGKLGVSIPKSIVNVLDKLNKK